MLSRRSFFISAATIALSQGLSGCSDKQALLQILLLQGSIPPQLLGDFRKAVKSANSLSFKPKSKLKELFSWLETAQIPQNQPSNWDWLPLIGGKPAASADLITLGDAWLAQAIKNKLIQPLSLANLPGWQLLPPRWQNLVKRNRQGYLDDKGEIWGAPYRWGTTMIVYRQDKFRDLGWLPTDWQDLWREELSERLSLIEQPREIIGLTLKKLGYSYNEPDLTKISELKSELISLQKQVKFYSSEYYLQPLVLGDTWLAVGWSSDILPLLSRNPNLKAIIPQSGTSLWTDIWVQPAKSQANLNESSLAQKWIDFCWQPQSINQISLFSHGTSPLLETLPLAQIVKEVKEDSLLSVNPEIFAKSEFLLPLPQKVLSQYESLWQQIRQ